ncbi:GerAB/ArcD/ProY family transporter [Alicyclobacillus ferrooxydans]|uniref:Uncharacterized protein n=1 Tax=Alicyclobacillus ferrooxydans TaxID=471514 RepID=A0A0P9C8Y7_9BACL|nr:endospore germination permease [Alicyclobacillus ferrooxydans]KPV41799.1 hypothetical protein AN477_20405 [Alicyclobacillus ferrooxydans]
MNRVRVSNVQIITAIFGTTAAYGHFVYTGLVFRAVGRDAWFCLLLGVVIGTGILYMQTKLAQFFGRASLIQYTMSLFGRWAGSIVSWIYILFFCFVAGLTIQELSLFMGVIYPETPARFFLIFEFLLIAWVVRGGGEVVTRVIQLILPILVIVGLAAALFSMRDKDPSELLPLFDHSFMNFVHGTLIYVVMVCDLIVFGMYYSDVVDIDKLVKKGWIISVIAVLMFIGPTTGPIMVFGQKLAAALPYPTFAEIKYIHISGVFERMDIAAVLLWTMGAYVRASVYVLGATRAVAHLFNEQRETLYTLPVTVFVAGLSLSVLPNSREDIHQFLYSQYLLIALFVGLVLPLITVLLVLIRGKGVMAAGGG